MDVYMWCWVYKYSAMCICVYICSYEDLYGSRVWMVFISHYFQYIGIGIITGDMNLGITLW